MVMCKQIIINFEKSHFVIFHLVQVNLHHNVCLSIKNRVLIQKSCLKYFGLNIDSSVTWKEHINELCKKVFKVIRRLKVVKMRILFT